MITIKHKETGAILYQDPDAQFPRDLVLDNINLHGADMSG